MKDIRLPIENTYFFSCKNFIYHIPVIINIFIVKPSKFRQQFLQQLSQDSHADQIHFQDIQYCAF